MLKLTLDLGNVDSKELLHDTLAGALQLPEYYGRNLDALHDVLTDISSDTFIKIKGFDEMKEALGGYADGMLNVFEDSEEENRHLAFSLIQGE